MAPLMVTAVTGFISTPLFVRFLGTENYAIWGYAMAFAAVFGFADLGLGVAVDVTSAWRWEKATSPPSRVIGGRAM